MSKNIRMFLAAIAIVVFSMSVFAQNVMFVVSTDPMTEGDQAMHDLFTSWGYTLTPTLSSDLAFFTDADYADFDMILASESVGSGSLAPLKLIPKPLLNSESWASKPSALAWSDPASSENIAPEPCVIVDDTGHELAAGMAAGTVFDLCSDAAALINPTIPTVDVIPIAALASNPTKLVLYGIPAGTVLTDGDVSANAAVNIGVHEFGYLYLTDAVKALYKAAAEWLLGTGGGGGAAGGNVMFVVSTDPMTEGDQAMHDLVTSWGYTLTPTLSSDLAFFTDADYADFDMILASESVGSGSLAPLKLVPKPLVNSESWASKPSALAWSDPASAENIAPEPCVVVDDTNHPLAAGMAAGTVFDLCSDAAALINPTIPTVDVIPIAALASNPTKLVLYGIPAGTVLTDGDVSANYAVNVGVHEFGYLYLTDAAKAIYKAAIEWVLNPMSAVEQVSLTPANYSLSQNYPNPFNPTTQINYSVNKDSQVKLTVFNLMGQAVATLVDMNQNMGQYSVMFDATGLNSGVYYYQLQTNEEVVTHKMLLTK